MSPVEVLLLILVIPATLYQLYAGLQVHALLSYAGACRITTGLQYAIALTIVIQILFVLELFAW